MRPQRLSRSGAKAADPAVEEGEYCMNPWNGVCRSADIVLYIYYRGRRLPICRKCWLEIASSDAEWRYGWNARALRAGSERP